MNYTLHPGAERDITEALDFYCEHAGFVVAERFLDEFERVANLLLEYPGLGTLTTRGRRAFPLKIFPYSVVYRNLDCAPSSQKARLRCPQAVKLSCKILRIVGRKSEPLPTSVASGEARSLVQ